MIDRHVQIQSTLHEIAHDWSLKRLVSGIFGRKMFGTSLNVPQLFDILDLEECFLDNFHLFLFKLVSLFLRGQSLND